jgi:nucleoside 2-deoxyribosyltransferase
MKMYLAGGINGLSDQECREWREKAKVLLQGHTILDPMDRDYRGIEDQNFEKIVTQDLADIDAADILIVNAAKPSWGTAMEIRYASGEKKKPVIAFTNSLSLSPWLLFHCIVVNTLEEAAHLALKRALRVEG